MELYEDIIEDWKAKRGDFENVKAIFKSEKLGAFFGMINFITTSIYYQGTVNLSNTMIRDIESSNEYLDRYGEILKLLLTILFVITFIFAYY